MANLKEIKNRITSISSTMQITSAMKMVSAAKLKRAQDAITQMRPYAEKLQEILGNLSATLDLSENAYSEQREVMNAYIIAVTSNRGLCGGFNNNVIKKVNALKAGEYAQYNTKIISIGKKANDVFGKDALNVRPEGIGAAEDMFNDLTFERSSEVAQYLMDVFAAGSVDKVVVIYNKFKNAALQEVMEEQFLPIVANDEEGGAAAGDYIFEPSKSEIVEDLLPKSLKIQLFKALLDSHASEHGARMTAMHKATDNAGELKRDLTLQYNKARQAAITNEILEIVGGAEALNG
ncbi:ATP synthase F1 subunit gamma [Crocinitomicaceae bacterium]|jgi:F-type H+-transporting ATPase subunit gamma|nr:ATP synthase F1 subunit gamma [Crocinitomicaceae bacterium]MDA9169042.1 ATP synthase F1 subunit gamma [Crocinitomicaceae bacterium]MDA9881666.1 ATP synthase F1 subunit gamma [Crocinitomicaceae bacterium]MDG1037062.1 ATP synthase F1 subunit gamma [Crocinitomicaceae bacterium]